MEVQHIARFVGQYARQHWLLRGECGARQLFAVGTLIFGCYMCWFVHMDDAPWFVRTTGITCKLLVGEKRQTYMCGMQNGCNHEG